MIGHDSPWFYFNRDSIIANAPRASGVYALFTAGGQRWTYFGESGNIEARLLEHLNGDNPCITRNAPNGFQFEAVPAYQRVARQNQLIANLVSLCNQQMG